MLLYVGYYFTIIYGVAEIYIHCFSSYACLLGVEIFWRPWVYKQIYPYKF